MLQNLVGYRSPHIMLSMNPIRVPKHNAISMVFYYEYNSQKVTHHPVL
ncbi:7218_t:CDS:2 [Acaulospora colombiana]|uniref:7218_t:CDS:1 n=1 Tax=Acaulospora colombiana TaxID=27376 RepID=A0ACA9KHS7_9GLOM|nr:7218_t:CDS:2 [Acaulospora colombiana]